MFTCDILPLKSIFKKESSEVDKQSVNFEIKCHCGCHETYGVALGGGFVGIGMLLGRSMGGCFVKAPKNSAYR
jgi:hypothetical protein